MGRARRDVRAGRLGQQHHCRRSVAHLWGRPL